MRMISCGMVVACLFAFMHNANAGEKKSKTDPGYTSLFNGNDLTGWILRKGKKPLDGKTETEKKRFQVEDGAIVIDGKARGNMVIDTAKSFKGDVHIKFQFKAGKGCNNDLYFRGLKFDIKKGGVKNLKLGEWQQFEIIARGKKVEFISDGETQRVQNAKAASSPLGIRAEFGAIAYRRLQYKKLP